MSFNSFSLQVIAKVLAETSVTSVPTMAGARVQPITPGVTAMYGPGQIQGQVGDLNTAVLIALYPLEIAHHLSDPFSETAYYNVDYRDDMETLSATNFWDTIPGSQGVQDEIVSSPIERFGNVLVYGITVSVAFT